MLIMLMSIISSSIITTIQNTLLITHTTSMLAKSMSMPAISVNMLHDNIKRPETIIAIMIVLARITIMPRNILEMSSCS